jgi:hypothetical protein
MRAATGSRRRAAGIQQRPEHGVAHEQGDHHDAGQNSGDEQARDRYLGHEAVDDEHDRRRDEQAEGARAGERAQDHALVIAPLAQLGDGDLADGGAGRGRRAGDGGEDAAAQDVDVHQAPGQAREPRAEAVEHVLGEARAEQDLGHPDEQRQGGQRPAAARAPDRVGHHPARGHVGEQH